jgi:hypothetical protein
MNDELTNYRLDPDNPPPQTDPNGDSSGEDLGELRIVPPTDRRAEDSWAFDDNFVKSFLVHTFSTRHQKDRGWAWKRAIDLYWKQGVSRRELAVELDRSLDAIKSLIKTIRKAAERFLANGGVVQSPKDFNKQVPAKKVESQRVPYVPRTFSIMPTVTMKLFVLPKNTTG